MTLREFRCSEAYDEAAFGGVRGAEVDADFVSAVAQLEGVVALVVAAQESAEVARELVGAENFEVDARFKILALKVARGVDRGDSGVGEGCAFGVINAAVRIDG